MAEDDYSIITEMPYQLEGKMPPPDLPIRNGDIEMVQYLKNRAVREVHRWIVEVGKENMPLFSWPDFTQDDGIQYEREPEGREIVYALWIIDKECDNVPYKKGRDPPRMFQDLRCFTPSDFW